MAERNRKVETIDIVFPKSVKKFAELQCNSALDYYTRCKEIEPIHDIIKDLKPKNVLDLGSGIGRISVYLMKRYGWNTTNFHLYDGNSGKAQIAGYHTKPGNYFYNSLAATHDFCVANGIDEDRLFCLNARKIKVKSIVGKFDLCYSFKAFGFHWPCLDCINAVYKKMNIGSYLFFEVRRGFKKMDYVELLEDRYDVCGWYKESDGDILVLQRI